MAVWRNQDTGSLTTKCTVVVCRRKTIRRTIGRHRWKPGTVLMLAGIRRVTAAVSTPMRVIQVSEIGKYALYLVSQHKGAWR